MIYPKITCCCQSASKKNQKRGYEMVERTKYDGDDEDELDGIDMDDEEKATLDMLESYRDKLNSVVEEDDDLNDIVESTEGSSEEEEEEEEEEVKE